MNPQRSGWRSETRVCTCCFVELQRLVLFISDPLRGTIDGRILLKVGLRDNGILLGKRY